MPTSVFTKTHFKLRFALWCCLFLAASTSAEAADIFRLWHGVGIQGSQSNWSTEIDLRKAVVKVIYPSLKCGGEWQKLGSLDGVYEYREIITIGRDICIDSYVRVYLLNKKRMAIVYSESRSGPSIAKAVVFPGPHHEERQEFMFNVTRRFIASKAK
jgi:hypothetical protein